MLTKDFTIPGHSATTLVGNAITNGMHHPNQGQQTSSTTSTRTEPPLARHKPNSRLNNHTKSKDDTPRPRLLNLLDAQTSALQHILRTADLDEATEKTALLKHYVDEVAFPDETLHQIYEAVLTQYEAARPIDAITVVERLTANGLSAACDALHQIFQVVGSESEWSDCLHTLINWQQAQTTKPTPRFCLLSLESLSQRAPREMLIERVLVTGGTSLLTAKHASFKSFIALDMALCVAFGTEWHGLQARRGTVIYIASEGVAGLMKRIKAWMIHHGFDELPSNFYIIEEPVQIHEQAIFNQFLADLEGSEPALIVIDTLNRCAVGLEENSSKDMGRFAKAVDGLARDTGAHVMVIHHNNKNGEYRGSTALPAAVDTHISLERNYPSDSLLLKFEKTKDFEEPAPMLFDKKAIELNSVGREHSLVFTCTDDVIGGKWKLSQQEQKILDELHTTFGEEGATSSAWMKACGDIGVPERTFYQAKQKLIRLGTITKPDEGKERGFHYRVIPDWCNNLQKGAIAVNCSEQEELLHRCNHPSGVAPMQ